ncbi:MAG TPA: flavin monoamine oxidase family protein [Polyangia bacterium]|jgi:monoamine oxidase|nr:flavin monoamine oxidase family protein [Polyangia bacterium]
MPSSTNASPSAAPDILDVLIIGAGLAGLSAARALDHRGVRLRVLEARDRVGGRTLTHTTRFGDRVDLGAQWIGPTQDRVLALVKEFGLTPFPQHEDGRKVLSLGGRISTYRKAIPSLPLLGLLDLDRTIRRLEKMCRQVPLDAPHTAPRAAEWDGLTVEAWKRRNVHTRGARALLDIAVEAVFAAEPDELSLLYFLHYLHAGGGLLRLSTIRDGAQETRVAEGTQEISKRLAAPLGERVVLRAPVRALRQEADRVVVTSDAGDHSARYVIVAIPPALAARIAYGPPLPAARDHLLQRMPMGSVIKCVAFYEEPFWRAQGYSGEAISDTGPVRLVFDDSPADASHGALVAFVLARGVRAVGASAAEERRQAVLAELARLLGPRAAECVDYVEQDWTAEEWSRGCYAGLMAPGVLSAYGQELARPCGRIHWAGTETATVWTGYMEGAIRSGERAAEEVAARLDTAVHAAAG